MYRVDEHGHRSSCERWQIVCCVDFCVTALWASDVKPIAFNGS